MSRPLLTGAGTLAIAFSAMIVLTGNASAHPLDLRTATVAVQQVTVGEDADLVPLVVDRLAPGSSASARFEVHRGSRLSGGEFTSEIADVTDYENGCLHSEVADGDSSCGTGNGEGELSSQLHVTQQWSAANSTCSSPPSEVGPTLAAAGETPVRAPTSVSTADTVCLTLVVDLPPEANNLVQSDSSRFALRIGLVGAAHEGDLVGGGGLTLGGGTITGPGAGLPLTGLDPRARLAAAGLALLTGTGLVLAGRRAHAG